MCATLILDAPFQARTLPLFYKLEWLPINQICIERRLIMFKKILDGPALQTTSLRNYYHWNAARLIIQDLGCLTTSPFHKPTTGSERYFLMLFNCGLILVIIKWRCLFHHLKKFRRNYLDCTMCKFTPDSFKTDRIF